MRQLPGCVSPTWRLVLVVAVCARGARRGARSRGGRRGRADRLGPGPLGRLLHRRARLREVSRREVAGDDYERLEGVFGSRARVVRLRSATRRSSSTEYLAPRGRPAPADARSNDRWFQHVAIIVSDMDRAYQWLREHKVAHASPARSACPTGTRTPAASAPSTSRIRTATARDHLRSRPARAIRVAAADRRALPRHRPHRHRRRRHRREPALLSRPLGFRVAGESENYGTEQEHLNNVFGARLRITSLRAAAGPGIELLEYLAPRDGRAVPARRARERPRPLADAARSRRRRAAAARCAPPARDSSRPGGRSPERRARLPPGRLVRDPDGHAMAAGAP